MTKQVRTAVVNSKGGVGKSTTAANLMAVAASLGIPSLLIDFDPQGSCPKSLGVDQQMSEESLDIEDYAASRILYERIAPSELAYETEFGFDIVPAGHDLIKLEQYLPSQPNGDALLARMLNTDKGLKKYDLILCDTPGFQGHIATSVINAVGDIIIPNLASSACTREINTLKETISAINEFRSVFPGLDEIHIRGHFFGRAEHKTQVHRYEDDVMSEKLSSLHLKYNYISKCAEVGKSEAGLMPLVLMEPKHKVTKQYIELFRVLFPELV